MLKDIIVKIKKLFARPEPRKTVSLDDLKKLDHVNIMVFLPYTDTFIELYPPTPLDIPRLYSECHNVQLKAIFDLLASRKTVLTTSWTAFKQNLDSRDIPIILDTIWSYLEKYTGEED